jgi:hypothetical protein
LKDKVSKSKQFRLKAETEEKKGMQCGRNLKPTILLEKRRKPTILWD